MKTQWLPEAVSAVMRRRLQQPRQRDWVASRVMQGFTARALRPVPDLDQRLRRLQTQVQNMAQNIELSFRGETPVVKVTGSAEQLLTQLRRGTSWYAPWDEIDEVLLAAVLSDPPK